MMTCPTCGQPIPPREMFDDDAHALIVGGEVRRLDQHPWAVLALLRRRIGHHCSREAMWSLLYAARPESDWPKTEKIVDIHLVPLRRALRGSGWRLDHIYNQGWALVSESHDPARHPQP